MQKPKFRSLEAREAIVAQYNVQPIEFRRLAPNEVIMGECGLCKDKIYEIKLIKKFDPHKGHQFYCKVGYWAGGSLLDLAGAPKIPLIDFNTNEIVPRVISKKAGPGEGRVLTPLNREIYYAMAIIKHAYNKKELTGLYAKIRDFIHENPEENVPIEYVWKFNKSLLSYKGEYMKDFLARLNQRWPKLRTIDFIEFRKITDKKCNLDGPQ